MTRLIWPPRIQVAGVSSLEEALFCRSVGVDSLGFTLELPAGVHDGLTAQGVQHIIAGLPPDVLPVIITYLSTAQAAIRLVASTGGLAAQFHGGIPLNELLKFREALPHVRTIGLVTVSGPNAMEQASLFCPPYWNALILDSLDPLTGRKGATGLTHDWTVSAEIVKASKLPVILAGGLNPDNVAEAIRQVRPAGVDAHTGLENPDGTRNLEKIRLFASTARLAFAVELGRARAGQRVFS